MTKKFHPHLLRLVWPMFKDGRYRAVRKEALEARKNEFAPGEYERVVAQMKREAAEYAGLNQKK